MKKDLAVAYLRCSSSSQVDGDTWDRQQAAINRWAKQNKIEIVQFYQEEGVSGTVEARPVLARMMADLKSNHTNVTFVVVEACHRLARDLGVQELIIRQIRELGRVLVSATEGDLDGDPSRTMMRQIMGAVAQYDRSMVVAKLQAARDRASERLGRRIEGRHKIEDENILNRIKELRKSKLGKRMSYAKIAKQLNEDGLKPPASNKWHASTVQVIVKRELKYIS